MVFILYRQLQKKLAKSNRAFTSAVIRVPALTEAPALNCVKTLNTSSTAHAPWGISEEQHLVKNCCRGDDGTDPSGVYQLFDPTNNSVYDVFCDFTSEKGFVWTLIESFSFRYNDEFKDKAFYEDHPLNQEAFTWSTSFVYLCRV